MIVAIDGSGDYISIQEAIDAVPDYNSKRVIINVKNGVYKEKIKVTKPMITLVGEGVEKTILTFDDYARMTDASGEAIGTFRTYTIFISGNDFIAQNITFENSAGSGSIVGQAVAVYADGDRVAFKNCRLLAHQDTLFTGPLPPKPLTVNNFGGPRDGMPRIGSRQYFESCYIKGDVDFIFGSATAVFNRCEIVSNNQNKEVNGYITAASTPEGNEFGYVFIDCILSSEAQPKTVYLGRPWRNFAKTVFLNCHMGAHIKDEGWDNWQKPESENTVEYGEYHCTGPGSQKNNRASWSKVLSTKEAERYSIENILKGIDDWNPIS